jgi:hypothetical protein
MDDLAEINFNRDKTGKFIAGKQSKKALTPAVAPALANERAPKPQAAKTRLQTAFLQDLAAEWEKQGASAIRIMAIEKPAEFVKVVASLMPKEVELDLANYVARVPVNVVDLDQWTELNQDLITKQP